MASKPLVSFSSLCMVILALSGSPVVSIELPEKATVGACSSAFSNVGKCYNELYDAFRTGRVLIILGPVCCKVIEDLNASCWPEYLGFSPFFPPVLQRFCSFYKGDPGTTLTPFGGAGQTPTAPGTDPFSKSPVGGGEAPETPEPDPVSPSPVHEGEPPETPEPDPVSPSPVDAGESPKTPEPDPVPPSPMDEGEPPETPDDTMWS